MTKHEADVIGGLNMTDQISNEAYKQIMIAAQDENEPCEDCISRQALITRLDDFVKWCKDGRLQGAKFALDVVGDMPPVNPKQKWIPVSERLPEKDKYTDFYKCMVARLYTSRSNTCDICIAYFDGKRFLSYDSHGIVSGVKAWMPLPELYDPQESEG